MEINFDKKVEVMPDWIGNSFHSVLPYDYTLENDVQISFILTVDVECVETFCGDYFSPPETECKEYIHVDALRVWISDVEQELSPEEIKRLEKEIKENVTWN